MVSFTATYTSATGQPRTVTVKANDAVAARRLLRRRGIKAEELRQDKGQGNNKAKADPKRRGSSSAGLLSMDLGEAFQKPPGVKEKAIWASKLAALVDAGVPIVRSLDLMATQQKLPMFKKALTKRGTRGESGHGDGSSDAAMAQGV